VLLPGDEMKTIKTILVIIMVMGILLTACGSAPSLNGTKWRLTRLAGQPALTETEVTLNLDDGALGGNDGCNSYGGSYTSEGNTIKVGTDIISTMMYCNEQIQTQTNAYYDALLKAVTFKLTSGKLSLQDSSGTVLAEFEGLIN
jgi:heat shock protein HslJ